MQNQSRAKLIPCLITLLALLCPNFSYSEELLVGKVCPVIHGKLGLGILVFSREWYHDSRSEAGYIPGDNATGVGLEIHFFASDKGDIDQLNMASCNRYRMLQMRTTNARLLHGEKPTQIDVPDNFTSPFYDNSPLEHGYGVHLSPKDSSDKPWDTRPVRASTVGIYDTPYVSDSYGIEGEDIAVSFETCVVCERDQQYDQLLSCGTWSYKRDYMGGMTGWAEPEFEGVQCQVKPSEHYKQVLNGSNRIEYSYWINWR